MEKKVIFLKFLAGFVAAVLLGGIAFALIYKAKIEGEGFETPEDAFMAYLTALQKTDREAIFETFAIESLVEKMNWDYGIKAGVYSLQNGSLYTDIEGEFTEELLLEMRIGQVNRLLEHMFYELSGTLLYGAGYEKVEDADAFIKEHFPEGMMENKLKDIQIKAVQDASEYPEYPWHAFYEENREDEILASGAEDYRIVIAELVVDGNECYLLMDCVKYDGRWYNAWLGASAFGMGFIY